MSGQIWQFCHTRRREARDARYELELRRFVLRDFGLADRWELDATVGGSFRKAGALRVAKRSLIRTYLRPR